MNFRSRDRLFWRCREPPWVSLKSGLCLYTANTNRVYIKDFPPTVTAEQIDALTLALSLSHLPVLDLSPFPPSSFLPSFPPPPSFSLSHLAMLAGWSVTLLCAHWPVAGWWFMAEESGRGFGRWSCWMARFKITCGGVRKRSVINECSLCPPITMIFLQRTVGF